ncbi:hypothetical protein [Solirubrobacter soli]|uniref:hypothetical protein n=1 Tax=Solirubrobacter soli TaxID=363832 RepID=UPI00040FD086|nr:hypothetical protein [Solirubrobacter soli]
MELIREIPDVGLAAQFDGEPLVQSFRVRGRKGRVWITTREAFEIPGFGAPWVAGRLVALEAQMGKRALVRALRAGIRLHADTRELALAA